MAIRNPSLAVAQVLRGLTHGKAFAFVIMSFNRRWSVYEAIKGVLRDSADLMCLRADEVHTSGQDLLAKVHFLLENSELVIAEISDKSDNVYYEVGFALAVCRPLLLVAERRVKIPTNLRGLEVIRYEDTAEGMAQFRRELAEHVRDRAGLETAQLHDMLVPSAPLPAYIVASPRYPKAQAPEVRQKRPGGAILGQLPDKRTFGDNLGIRGLLAAFGLIHGGEPGVELVSAHYCEDSLTRLPASLYLIGSRKSNRITGQMLPLIQRDLRPKWVFDPAKGEKDEGDWRVVLYRVQGGKRTPLTGEKAYSEEAQGIVHTSDYGIIVRSPHSRFPKDRLVMVMAGAHSLGTGAACIAATTPRFISDIRARLRKLGVALDHTQTPFWVLVKGVAAEDGMLEPEGVSIQAVGAYSR